MKKIVRCYHCLKKFQTEEDLRTIVTCPFCGYNKSTVASLKRHYGLAPLIIDVDENPGYTFETYEDDPNDDEICDFDDVDIDDMDIDKIEYEKTMGDESSHNINALNNELIDENIIDDIFFQPIKHYKVENEKIFRIQE